MARPVYGQAIRVDTSSRFLLERVTWRKMATNSIGFYDTHESVYWFPEIVNLRCPILNELRIPKVILENVQYRYIYLRIRIPKCLVIL